MSMSFCIKHGLSDVIENVIAPCPAVPSLFAVVDDDDDTDVGGAG
jgi:Rrf2 family iron-sulfur cluster assembly transcriptional regulator